VGFYLFVLLINIKNLPVKSIFIFLISLIISVPLLSQEIIKPNFALATHPMVIDKINVSDSSVLVTLTLKNKVEGGEFCANEIIYIQELKRKKKAYLLKASGIPVCPNTYKFDKPGEELTFELEFFGFYETPDYINIIEDCNANCFTIYGIIINKEMNHDVDMGFSLYKSGNPELSVASFEKAVKEHPDYPFGYLHENIIDVYAELKNYEKAREWYQLLISSNFVDKDQILEQISRKDYFNHLETGEK